MSMSQQEFSPATQVTTTQHAPPSEHPEHAAPSRPAPLSARAGPAEPAGLAVGAVHDHEETQAEQVADRVVAFLRAKGGAGSRQPAAAGPPRVRRSPAEVGAAGGATTGSTAGMIDGLRRTGQPLPPATRSVMESALGSDLSGVRVSVGARAAEANDRVQAQAFTVGNNVVFRDGMPDVGTESGQRLLAHELAHVVQNSGRDPAADLQRRAEPDPPSHARRAQDLLSPGERCPEPEHRHLGDAVPIRRALGPVRRASTLRRLVGFEVELSVPTYAARGPALGDSGQEVLPDADISYLFGGGLPYRHNIGTLPSPSGNIDLTSDHNALQRHAQALFTALRVLNNALLPAGSYVPLSNLEYSTPALDELAPGSNAQFQALATAIDTHAQAILNANPQQQTSPIPHAAHGELTGVPAQHLREWIPNHQHAQFNAQLATLTGAVGWSMYLQATVGVLPSGLTTMYGSQAAGLPAAAPGVAGRRAGAKLDAATAVVNAAAGVNAMPFWTAAIAGLPNGDVEALRGAVTVAISYAIGNAMGQTDLVGGTQKNAVQMLLKLQNVGDVAALANTAAVRGLATHAGMPAFVAGAAAYIAALPQATLAHWTAAPHLGVPGRQPILGPGLTPLAAVTSMLNDLLTGTNNAAVIGSGNPIPAPDPAPAALAGNVAQQRGVPMELRWISDRPNAAGQLWPALLSVLTEVRNANLVHLPAGQRAPILAAL